jgi:hypothetical protein
MSLSVSGVLHRLLDRLDRALHEVGRDLLECQRISVVFRCLGPDASAVTNGRLTVVCVTEDSSTLAFSAASNRRCSACGSARRSMPLSRWNSSPR